MACTTFVGSSVTLQIVSLPPSLHYTLLSACVAATLTALYIIVQGVSVAIPIVVTCGCVAATPVIFMLQDVLLPPHFVLVCTQQDCVGFLGTLLSCVAYSLCILQVKLAWLKSTSYWSLAVSF